MEDFERELKEDFLEESLQLLEDSEQAFLALEDDKESSELLDQIFRLAHNLKGTSRAVGFGEVAEFTHEMENLILKVKTGEVPVTDHVVTILLECNDHITHMIHTLKDDLDATFDSAEIISKILAVLSGEAQTEVEEEAISEPVAEVPVVEEVAEEYIEDEVVASDIPSADSFEEIPLVEEEEIPVVEASDNSDIEISEGALESLKELGLHDENLLKELEMKTASTPKVDEGMKIKQGEDIIASDKPKPAPEPAAAANVAELPKKAESKKESAAKKKEDESIRVSLNRVEKLNNVVGELVILQTVLDQRRSVAIKDQLANKSISQLGKLSKEIQEISMSLRMIPLKTTLQKMNRIVRDTSKALDKKVKLHLKGEETEIDKTVLEHLSDPLVHIVRNACDHGLESTEGRIKAGKDETGNVYLSAYHEGNNLVIEVQDDGGGIPAEIIKKKAIEKGILKANSNISDHDIIQYIFHPGFSTKEQVTEVSGRGVGMDVVKTNIERMSGSINVTTEMGKGSIFKISLPLTMAIIEGMVIRLGTEKYILPLNQVHESLRPTANMVNFITGFGECLNLRGEVLPLFNLGKTLGRKMDEGESTEKIAIIIQSSNFKFAVLVDDILLQQQVVIKSIGKEIRNSKGFMGSSILGDGRPSFIVDLLELFGNSLKKSNNSIKENLQRVA